jgi:vacuolar-type H+-ATPase subunit E/Vma4
VTVAAIGKGLETYLHRQATEVALNYLAEAREQAAKIGAQAEVELLQTRQLYEKQSERTNDQERRRSLAKARLAVNHKLTLNNEQALQEVWKRVEASLRDIVQADAATRCAVLEELITDAATQLQGGSLELQVSLKDIGLLKKEFIDALLARLGQACGVTGIRLNPLPVDIWGGVIVSRLESNQLVDNSFETRLTLGKHELRNQVFQILDTEGKLE